MLERGLATDFSAKMIAEAESISGPAPGGGTSGRDLSNLLWCSIDNDDSRDLDQLSVAEGLPNDEVKVYVAVADVDALVIRGSAIDNHPRQNSTSVYTVAETFPMLPLKLSTDFTSLNEGVDPQAIVIEMTFGADGVLQSADIFGATVRNKGKLAYISLGGVVGRQRASAQGSQCRRRT